MFEDDYAPLDHQFSKLVRYQVPIDILRNRGILSWIYMFYASVAKTINTALNPESWLFIFRINVTKAWLQVNRFTAGPTSPDLLKVTLDIIPSSLCKTNYASIGKKQLMHGIVEDSMICAGYAGGEKDTCAVSCMCFLSTQTF